MESVVAFEKKVEDTRRAKMRLGNCWREDEDNPKPKTY
jgi:hypothetical protein